MYHHLNNSIYYFLYALMLLQCLRSAKLFKIRLSR
jgi:hypothetical protein